MSTELRYGPHREEDSPAVIVVRIAGGRLGKGAEIPIAPGLRAQRRAINHVATDTLRPTHGVQR